MKPQIFFRKFICLFLLMQTVSALAFETDQYNLPPAPLADIGGEVTNYIETNIQKAIDKLNKEIAARENCLREKPKKSNCDSIEKERKKLESLRDEKAVAREVYNLLGTGIPPFTASETWIESYKFQNTPARYKTNFRDSIFFVFPTDYIGLGSTVNLYGTEFGTDKIAHFFQQGYSYYKKYNDGLAEGLSDENARRKAVNWGRKTERTIYGTLISGVYSNADLYANYAGMKFYLGLTKEIKIGESARPAVLILKDGFWKFNDSVNLPQNLIKPFISNHLNEAFNPSVFTNFLGLRAYVRRKVKSQSCSEWFNQFPNLSQTKLEEIFEQMKNWHGEDYGFTDSKNFITIANTCFDNKTFGVSRQISTLTPDFSAPGNSP